MIKNIVLLFAVTFITKSFAQAPNWVLFDHTNAPFVNDSITWVEVDTNNVKWIGTQNGLYSFYNNAWTVYNTSNSNIPSNRIDKFKIAYDNTIWFLNHNNGFVKFKNNVFTLYNKVTLPTLSTDSLVGLTIDSNDVFFWSNYNGISKYNSVTNSVYNINTTNSCLKKIETLVYHQNHKLYGVCKNPIAGSNPPQNKTDSIKYANDFVIFNTPTITINYCFSNLYSPCTYWHVIADKFQNRYEFRFTGTNSIYLKTIDKNNVLVSDVMYYLPPDYQRLTTNYGVYELSKSTNDYFTSTIFTPYSSNTFQFGNSIIPNGTIINFDSDKYNNVWLATPSGLVGYNDQVVITNIKNEVLSNISIYPNPANENLTLAFSEGEGTEQVTIEITNTLGQVVLKEKMLNTHSILTIQHLQSGVYYVALKTIKGFICKKFVKE